MSKKKKKQKAEARQTIKQETPIQDDPYWKVSGLYMDAHRVGRFLSRFERFDEIHPEWVDDLMNGVPTYYCILDVERGTKKEDIEKAYEKKLKFSSYPDETIEEAFDVLSNPGLQKEYDELLFIFEQITKSMLPQEKNELIRKHSTYVSTEKEYARMRQVLNKYRDYNILYMLGMPDIYEVVGLAKDSTYEEIKKRCQAGTELLKRICTILGESGSREEYDFMLYFIGKHTEEKSLEKREKLRKNWKKMDKRIIEKIILAALSGPDGIQKYMVRGGEILNSNQDWKQYLPPNRETFLSILGLDKESLPGDKKEIERTIREKYRYLEKTTQVNLAYSVLKNASQRDDYLWLLENHDMLDTIDALVSKEEYHKKTERETPLVTQDVLDAIVRILEEKASSGAKKRKGKTPTPQEVVAALSSIFAEKEKPPRKIKKGKNKTPYTQATFADNFEE
ncbi:MAG: hypothetical protein OIN66_10220 [Candidatus Methanoperedens sp.]|nr:hypothetical protein [Candidatus Methanoperedens sp.]